MNKFKKIVLTLGIFVSVVAVATLTFRALFHPTTNKLEYVDIYENSVIGLSTEKGALTGFYISKDYIITNGHGFDKNTKQVRTSDGNLVEIIKVDKVKDLALLKVLKHNKTNIQPLPICENQSKIGTKVFSVGYGELVKTLKKGYNNINEYLVIKTGYSDKNIVITYFFDGNIKQGDSGSPVIQENERCVESVLVAKSGKRNDVSFAIPLDILKEFLKGSGVYE